MFYISFVSASKRHVDWLRETVNNFLGCKGHMKKDGRGSTYQLTYAKKESFKILKKMYASKSSVHLGRKRLKTEKILGIVGKRL